MPVTQEIQEQMLKEATSATPNYSIDYNDPRFTQVNDAKNDALDDLDQTYAGMIGQSDKFYQDQINASKAWADQQAQIQQQQTDFAIEKIEQEKEQAHKDYLKEQSGAYVDWQKQSNQYGTNAEQMASAGLTNTGFAESAQVGMYNAYQNRVAMARESYNKAVMNYNNSIKDAILQNNAKLAEIAFQALQQQLELSLEGFQYKNQLILDQSNKKIELDNMYYNRYQDVLSQINTENAIKEDIRQYNETQKWQTEQAEKNREHDKTMADIEYQYQVKRDEETRTFQTAQAELDRKHELAVITAKTAAEKDIADKEWEIEQKRITEEHNNKIALIDHEYQKQIELEEAKNPLIDTVTTTSKTAQMTAARQNNRSSNPRVQQYEAAKTTGDTGGKFTSTTKTTSNNVPIDYKSLSDIGLSAVSETTLAQMVARGEIYSYIKNGKRYFYKNPMYGLQKYRIGMK